MGISLKHAVTIILISFFLMLLYIGQYELQLITFFSDLNRLIMDYLVIEGYKSAAEEFSQEADIAPPVDLESIQSRMGIREALQRGDIEEAITKVNDLNPEVRTFPLTPF
jgi:hypothetical protein